MLPQRRITLDGYRHFRTILGVILSTVKQLLLLTLLSSTLRTLRIMYEEQTYQQVTITVKTKLKVIKLLAGLGIWKPEITDYSLKSNSLPQLFRSYRMASGDTSLVKFMMNGLIPILMRNINTLS